MSRTAWCSVTEASHRVGGTVLFMKCPDGADPQGQEVAWRCQNPGRGMVSGCCSFWGDEKCPKSREYAETRCDAEPSWVHLSSSTQEAEVRGLLEPRSLRPAWATSKTLSQKQTLDFKTVVL